ncbi:MAG TPA: hypothetical protein VNZ53_17835 [Steroidobacteraceae bacterium]|nr:hypothetical protein [Steroidobacteraceae bacterium]
MKDVVHINFTQQLRAQYDVAKLSGAPFSLVVSPRNETISRSVINAVNDSGGLIVKLDPQVGRITEYLDLATGVWLLY